MALNTMIWNEADAIDENLGSQETYEEFLELFSRHRERLFAHIFALIPHEADAEDIFQRCSILLWRKFPDFDDTRSQFPTWACGVALNEIRNFVKSRRRSRLTFQPELLEQLSEDRLSDEDFETDRIDALRNCVERLHPRERELVRIAYDESVTIKDYATQTNQSLQALYNKLAKVRRLLLACVERTISREGRYE